MRRIVEAHRHLRESQIGVMAMFLSPILTDMSYVWTGLYQPHTDIATMPGTGTSQPTSCGKGPTAVGESVMVLPGISHIDAIRLTGKGSDLCVWGRSRHSSRRQGKPATGRRTAVSGVVGIGTDGGAIRLKEPHKSRIRLCNIKCLQGQPERESRMHGNVPVRFGRGLYETY
jgi:hypothetical protein